MHNDFSSHSVLKRTLMIMFLIFTLLDKKKYSCTMKSILYHTKHVMASMIATTSIVITKVAFVNN